MDDLLAVHDATRLIINRFVEPYETEVEKLCEYIAQAGAEKDLLDELRHRTANLRKVSEIATGFELSRIAKIEQGIIRPEPVREDIEWADVLAESDGLNAIRWRDEPEIPLEISCANGMPNSYRVISLTYNALHNATYDQSFAVNTNWKRSHLWGYQYTAILDNRTRPAHKGQHGVTAPINSPFWKKWYPPNGYCCRCRCYPVYRKPKSIIRPKRLHLDPGFDFNPGEVRIIEGQFRIEDMVAR